jgi:Ca-activated chloride channel family protein
VFIVDVSGSMNGFPLDISKKLLRELIGKLRPTDRFNVMLFESSNQMLAEESMAATQDNINKAIKVIDEQKGGGGTRLMPALKNALAFKETKDFSRTFIVVTDGYVSVEREAFDLIRDNLNKANLFAFGIGSSVNRYLIEGMAKVGMGEPFIITNQQEAPSIADKFRNYIQNPVLTNIQLAYNGFEVYDLAQTSIPDVFAERPIIIYGKYRGNPSGTITLTGLSGNKTYKQVINVSEASKNNNQALRYLWARKKIETLDDYNRLSINYWGDPTASQVTQMIQADPSNKDRIDEVTRLGLKYNLLTAYTSFIAIDSEIRNVEGTSTTIKQPLPLPEGVSDLSIGKQSNISNSTTMNYYSSGVVSSPSPEYKRSKNSDKKGDSTVLKSEDKKEEIIDVEEELWSEVEEKSKKVSNHTQAVFSDNGTDLITFIQNNLNYPEKAKQAGLTGKVTISFTIKADGTLDNIKITNSLSSECDAEAVRVLKLTIGKWTPAYKKGKATDSKENITIAF